MTKLVDLSQPFGFNAPLWPYCPDISISRMHYHARNGVFTQWISAPMHVATHADSPVHVIAGELYTHELPLDWYYGTGVIVDIPNKGRFGNITAEDLEKATPKIEKGDIVIIHTHMHAKYSDDKEYFAYSPGLVRSAGEWLVAKPWASTSRPSTTRCPRPSARTVRAARCCPRCARTTSARPAAR